MSHQRVGDAGLTNRGGQDTCVAVISMPLTIKMAVIIINNGSQRLLSPYDGPGTLLRALLMFSYSTLPATPVKEVLLLSAFYSYNN